MQSAQEASAILCARGSPTVILTLGERGAVLHASGQSQRVAAPTVTAVDTSGAGDAFIGALAHFLARGDLPLPDIVHRACAISALSVTQPGTQSSYPDAALLNSLPSKLLA